MRRVFYGMAVCGSLLSSCVVPNLGGVVDAVGRETTVVVRNNGHPKDLRVYELDNAYYVEVQATWQHVSARCFHSWDPFQGSCGGFRFWEQHDASAPKEIFLQRLSAWEVEHLLQKKVPEASGPSFVPQAEFDYTRAKLCKPRPKLLRQYPDDSKWAYGEADDYYHCPDNGAARCSWLHYTMQPVAWAAKVVDVPLTVAINAPIYVFLMPWFATQEVLVQSGLYAPWEEETVTPTPLVLPVVPEE